MKENEFQDTFNQIVEFNNLTLHSEEEQEIETEETIEKYRLGETVELNYVMSAVMQQLAELIVDFYNEEKSEWLDDEAAILLRELNDLCEQVIDRMYNSDCELEE